LQSASEAQVVKGHLAAVGLRWRYMTVMQGPHNQTGRSHTGTCSVAHAWLRSLSTYAQHALEAELRYLATRGMPIHAMYMSD
jgi:hypothetical protein